MDPAFVGILSTMAASPASTAFERGIRPLLQLVLPEKAEAVLNFSPDTALLARIGELAEQATEGQISVDELAEYEG